ncbi:hypothetical protein VTN00DRAFT_8676 [Thermoascus crustaceus]|uniref:uncharacterized protein n=1 Tax=Thermoascus crustaceus TaxID=5088 RepID=UPI003744018D
MTRSPCVFCITISFSRGSGWSPSFYQVSTEAGPRRNRLTARVPSEGEGPERGVPTPPGASHDPGPSRGESSLTPKINRVSRPAKPNPAHPPSSGADNPRFQRQHPLGTLAPSAATCSSYITSPPPELPTTSRNFPDAIHESTLRLGPTRRSLGTLVARRDETNSRWMLEL